MAGNYPNAPSWRMAHDRDGTQWFKSADGVTLTQLTTAEAVTLNDESAGTSIDTARLYAIFPEKRDLDGYFVVQYWQVGGSVIAIEVSADTTNGVDGTWVSLPTVPTSTLVSPNYRSVIASTSLGIRAVRFTAVGSQSVDGRVRWSAIHLYGEITAGQSLDRLLLWHPTLDERVPPSYFDWGNVPRNSTATRDFRVKNVSSVKTANTVRVAMEALTDATPSVPGQHALSKSGGTYLAQQTIDTLAPEAISEVITLRRITPSNAVLGVNAFRVFADAASWS